MTALDHIGRLGHVGMGAECAAPCLSVVIKALNEESKIGACLQSVLQSLEALGLSWEIVLADSVSTDRTVEAALQFPVHVFQFTNPSERGCGAGVQLGYQHSRGEFVFFLDGDMVLEPGFLAAGLKKLAEDPGLGGVAGLLRDAAVRNVFDAHRVEAAVSSVAKPELWLNGGGLYRRQAIQDAGGYAANRNLKGWEEAELGMRVRSAGWRLERIAVPAVVHDGHARSTLAMLGSLWRSGRAFSSGVLLRQGFARPWFFDCVRLLAHPLGTLLWWCLGVMSLAIYALGGAEAQLPLAWLAVTVLLVLALLAKKRSLALAAKSLLMWHYWAAGLALGLFQPTISPLQPIDSHKLERDGSVAAGRTVA